MNKSKSFDDLCEAKGSLGSPSPLSQSTIYRLPYKGECSIELTLNYPRTDKFTLLSSTKQKEIYYQLFTQLVTVVDPLRVKRIEHVYEYCKSGHVHMHARISYNDTYACYPIGLIGDIVKKWISNMPHVKYQQYDKYKDKCMYEEYGRYYSPSIVCQFQFATDHYAEWTDYMNKQQSRSAAEPLSLNK